MNLFHSASRYHSGVLFFLGLLIITLIFKNTAISMVNVWLSDNSLYSHGILLLPISIYLLYREWNLSKDNLFIKFRPGFAFILSIFSLLWFFSTATYVQIGSQISFILILSLFIFAFYGLRNGLRLTFPILILLSSLPLWSIFSEPLQKPTAIIVNNILSITGYTSFQEGFYIHIPEGIFEVGDTCSGVRYQIAAITTTALYVFYSNLSFTTSTLFILISSLIAFLSNTIRIYIVVLAGHYTDMTHSLLEDHIWLGWFVFGFFFFSYILILEKVIALKPVNHLDKTQEFVHSKSHTTFLLIILIVLAAIGPSLHYLYSNNKQIQNELIIGLDKDIVGWTEIRLEPQWKPVWLPSDYELSTSYAGNSGTVDLFISIFLYQDQGRELINDVNNPFDPDKWSIQSNTTSKVQLTNGSFHTVNELLVSDLYGHKRLIWYWYLIGGKATPTTIVAKLQGVLSSLAGRSDASVFILSTNLVNGKENARLTLDTFFKDSYHSLANQISKINTN